MAGQARHGEIGRDGRGWSRVGFGRDGILRSVVMGHVALRIGSLRFGRYGALYFGVAVLVRDRLGKAGMVGIVVVRFVLEGRVSVVYERACCVLAGVVGCVGSLYGQASWDVARQV